MSQPVRRASKIIACATVLTVVGLLDQPHAFAGNALGGFVGGMIGGFVGQMPRYHSRAAPRASGYAPSSGAQRAPAADPPSAADSSRALASLAPPTTQQQQSILKAVVPSQSLGAVGSSDDLEQIGNGGNGEANRDYTSKVDDLIRRIQVAQSSQRSSKEGDVTEHSILESLDSAIRDARLQKFETFLGENWSPERLRVMILDRVDNEIGGLFDGTNRGAVSMNDLDLIIKKSARGVYSRLFETSELLAANRGSTLFVQRLYQTHGDLVNGDVRESSEQLLSEASASGVASVERLVGRDPNAFALRYRTQRIIFDCLSDNVEKISSSESGLASTAEIAKHVLEVGQQQCAAWVGAQLIDANGKVKPQEPMPLRVIWTAEGPKDDPSMYGRATDQL